MPVFRLPPYRIDNILNLRDIGQTVDWGLLALKVPDAWKVTQGAGVKVAVLDTGVQADHPDLVDRIAKTQDFTHSPFGAVDVQGHGTHCAGVVASSNNSVGTIGVAPLCSLYIYKVLGDDGSGYGEWIANGFDEARLDGCHIASASFGSSINDPIIAAAIKRFTAAGGFVIAAAGNSGPHNPTDIDWPGRLNDVVAVASIKKDGTLSSFSSRGPSVAVAAPGEQILSTYPNSQYARLSGTSMATPFVAGITALIVSKHLTPGHHNTPLVTRDDLVGHLKAHAVDAGSPGHDSGYGWGIVKVDELLQSEVFEPVKEIEFLGVKIHIPAIAGDKFSVTT